ncbi:MAG: NUDIX domain-containing protein [Thermomicrobiales bacterium]
MRIPAHVAIVVVTEYEGRFLLIEEDRGKPQGHVWYFPSGALEAGETLAEAARREVREESGYEVEPIEVVAVDHGAFTGFEGLHWWRIVVSARLASTTSAPVEEQDVTDIAWLTVDQIRDRALRNDDAVWLCDVSRRGHGLAIERCHFFADGRFEGFYE